MLTYGCRRGGRGVGVAWAWLSLCTRSLYMYPMVHFNYDVIVYFPSSVNVRGSFLMTKYSLGEMKKRNYGRILLVASIAGKEVGLSLGTV